MKKIIKTHAPKLNETEYEELIRLRAENEHIKTEIEVIKKSIALRREKWAAQLKAKKQQFIKELRKKGYQLKCLLQEIGMAKSTYY